MAPDADRCVHISPSSPVTVHTTHGFESNEEIEYQEPVVEVEAG